MKTKIKRSNEHGYQKLKLKNIENYIVISAHLWMNNNFINILIFFVIILLKCPKKFQIKETQKNPNQRDKKKIGFLSEYY